eukprot:PhF_6_TR42591/c0_g1_i1/m.64040
MFRRVSILFINSSALPTKGQAFGKHLDVYARRDAQLAPYLLREVDIEYLRKCRKVRYVVWVAILTALMLYTNRVETEVMYFMRPYLESMQDLSEAEDGDYEIRHRTAAKALKMIGEAKDSPKLWTKAYKEEVVKVLLSDEPVKRI